jgi:hypothetical protein
MARSIHVFLAAISLSIAVVLHNSTVARADQTVTVPSTADSFVRELDPSSNFGAAGLLCVAGSNSVNGVGTLRGRFDSVIRFNTASAVDAFNSTFGAGSWAVTSIQLQLSQVGAPENTFFPRGGGQFVVSWLSNDAWSEGMGTPSAPEPGSGDIITWQQLQTLVSSGTERTLGVFSVSPVDGTHLYSLSPDSSFVANVVVGGDVTLHLLAQNPDLGFTFHARDFGDLTQWPYLVLTAAPIVYGDMNCDGVVSTGDIAPFVLALLDPAAYGSAFPTCSIARADVNQDGAGNGRDVQALVSVILSP